MKSVRKILSAVLAFVMLISVMGALPVFAAEEKVLLEHNFDAVAEGAEPKGGFNVTENAEREAFARVVKEDGNGVLYIYRKEGNTAEGDAGPRVNYKFDMSLYESLTISYKVKSADTSAAVTLYSETNKKAASLAGGKYADWTEVVIKVDLKKGTAVPTVGGKAGKEVALPDFEAIDKMQIRFTAGMPKPGQGGYYDDIKIIGVAGAGAGAGAGTDAPVEVAAEPAFVPASPATMPTIPKDAHVFLNTNFDTTTLTDKAASSAKEKGTKIFAGGTDFTQIVDAGGNRMLRYWATDGKQHGPRVTFSLDAAVSKHVFDFAVMPVGEKSNVYVHYYADGTKTGTDINLAPGKKGVKVQEWNYLHIEIDTDKNTLTSTLNGEDLVTKSLPAVTNKGSIQLYLCGTINTNEVVYVDAATHYTTEEYKFDGPLKGNQEIAWENVKPSKPIDATSYVSNLKAHPRVFVHNWDEMRAKIDADYMTRQWYANIKKEATTAMKSSPTSYSINSRGNVLESARAARNRILSLAFVYKMEGDKAYLNRAYEEMLVYGEWPDWSGFTSTLVTAEILQGYAYCYDWLYDDLTAEQKNAIIEIVKRQALPDFIYAYNGQISNTNFVTGTINWNPVCNATIIAWAIATANETPEISEYILETVPPLIQHALPPYGPQGGYPEGVSYWDYGTTFLLYATDLLENAFVDGFTLPDSYVYWKAPGIADTPDYGIYYDGPAGRFNYGDCSTGHTSCEVMYWAASRFNKPHYAWWQNNRQLSTGAFTSGYSAVVALCWYEPENAYNVPGAFPLDKFYTSDDSVNGGTMRSSWNESAALFGALQGGNNKANHQHLSLGTYVIDYMGKRFIRQLNSYDYALKDPKATIYYKRDESSNCLVVNPTPTTSQNSSAVAKTIKSGTSDNTAFIVLDTTQIYDEYTSAKRGMMLTDNRSRIIVQDEVVTNKPSEFYWFANTDASIAIAKDGKSALLTIDGVRMLARIIEGPAEAKFEVMDRKSLFESVVQIAANKGGEKLFIHLKDKTALDLAVEYVALKDGEGIPAPSTFVRMDDWTTEQSPMTTSAIAGTNVALKIGTPNAIANGVKTFVDTNNADVVPFTENGRTLVPVRFIAEAFGAKVGWQEATQTVLVDYQDKNIQLVIGSNEMKVNGETVLLDVPANTYNSRTLIPLRALVEALGKEVFWDDRGLIVIGENISYTEEQIVKLINDLDVRVKVNGKDVAYFELDKENYTIDLKSGEAVPTIEVTANGGQSVSATQATAIGESAIVTVNGQNYTFKMQPYAFEGILGHKDPGVVLDVKVEMVVNGLPTHNTFIYVEDLLDSTGFATYPKRGIVDGVINSGTENRWAAQGDDQWIQMDFGSVKNVYSMAFAGDKQTTRAYNFEVYASQDGEKFTLVHTGGAQATNDVMYIIPLGGVQARYIKIVGKGNNQNAWNTYTEVRFYESAEQQVEDISYWPAYFGASGLSGKAGTTGEIKLTGMDNSKTNVVIRPEAIVTYAVEDPSIATISGNTISFLKKGTTTVTVTVTQDGFTTSATATITVE